MPDLQERVLKRNFLLLAVAVFCLSFGFGINISVFNNFIVERLGLEAYQLGILESIRETPGFLTVLIAGATVHFAEPLLGGIAFLLAAVGFMGYYHVTGFSSLIMFSLIWSIGFHLWAPLSSGLTLSLAKKGQKGRQLGRLGSVGALATFIGISMVYLTAKSFDYYNMYMAAGLVIGIGSIALFSMSREVGYPTKTRLLMRKKYSLYYLLSLLDGCRRQVFATFAIFALVKIYHSDVKRIALLMLLNNIVSFILGPQVGRLIDKIGERRILGFNYLVLTFIFLGYAFIRNRDVLLVLCAIDNCLFLMSMALTVYIEKIAPPAEMRPCLAMGASMNHLAAVLVPLIGGFLWKSLGYGAIFLAGAGITLVALVASQQLKVKDLRL